MPPPLSTVLLLALAGGGGTVARAGVSALMTRWLGASLWGTVAVNLIGCFLFGVVLGAFEGGDPQDRTRRLLLVGFMGAFTTFSTYIFDAGEFLRDRRYLPLLSYTGGQIVCGLLLLFLGIAAGRLLRHG